MNISDALLHHAGKAVGHNLANDSVAVPLTLLYWAADENKELRAEIERLQEQSQKDERGYQREIQRLVGCIGEKQAEIERLRRFLSIAIDDHDDAHGEVNPEARPNHWTVQARKLLGNEQNAPAARLPPEQEYQWPENGEGW